MDTVKRWRIIIDFTITPIDYISISTGLVTASTYLLVNVHKYFEVELKDEARRIRVIFLVLTVSYVSRAAVDILHSTTVIPYFWLGYLVMCSLWDILPLSFIMYYQYKNFKEQEKTLKRERVAQELEEQATQELLQTASSIPATSE